jgi:hypothetical protein
MNIVHLKALEFGIVKPVRKCATAPAFSYLRTIEDGNERMACQPKLVVTEGGPPSLGLQFGAKLRWTTFAWDQERRLVDQNNASWNPLTSWLRNIEALRIAA